MAWTTPGTAVAGSVYTAAFYNEQTRDNLNAIRDAQINVVQTVDTAAASYSGLTRGAFTASDVISVSITPSSSSSKILVIMSLTVDGDGNTIGCGCKLQRGGTDIVKGDAASNRTLITTGTTVDASYPVDINVISFSYLDSPATTSSVSYGVRICPLSSTASAMTIYVNRTHTDSDTNIYSRAASSLTAIEVPV